jgi:hypothetical protein
MTPFVAPSAATPAGPLEGSRARPRRTVDEASVGADMAMVRNGYGDVWEDGQASVCWTRSVMWIILASLAAYDGSVA